MATGITDLHHSGLLTLLLSAVCPCVALCPQAVTPGTDHVHGISIDVDEAELLNDVEMGGMSHGELVAHIRKVQQELLAKVRLVDDMFAHCLSRSQGCIVLLLSGHLWVLRGLLLTQAPWQALLSRTLSTSSQLA